MSTQTDRLLVWLREFDLADDESLVYLELLNKGCLSALTISRELHIGRTKVYRILDKLIAKEMVVQKYDEAGFKFLASSPTQLELLLAKKAATLAQMRASLPGMVEQMERLVPTTKGSEVFYYKGKRGLFQVNFNLLKARGEVLSYEIATADVYLPPREAETLRQGLVDKKIMVKTITNMTKIPNFTQVKELVLNWWEIRSIEPSKLRITADVFVYNDVYAICNYLGKNDVFCLEIHNKNLASLQRDIFFQLWEGARPMKIIGDGGRAEV